MLSSNRRNPVCLKIGKTDGVKKQVTTSLSNSNSVQKENGEKKAGHQEAPWLNYLPKFFRQHSLLTMKDWLDYKRFLKFTEHSQWTGSILNILLSSFLWNELDYIFKLLESYLLTKTRKNNIQECNTWYQMQAATTGMKIIKTCHATWDITAMIPKSWIIEKANAATWYWMFVSTVLWSVDAWNEK